MLTVFPTLVSRPTLSKMATRALKAPWSQAGSDETVRFIRQITGNYEWCQADGTWYTPTAEEVLWV